MRHGCWNFRGERAFPGREGIGGRIDQRTVDAAGLGADWRPLGYDQTRLSAQRYRLDVAMCRPRIR